MSGSELRLQTDRLPASAASSDLHQGVTYFRVCPGFLICKMSLITAPVTKESKRVKGHARHLEPLLHTGALSVWAVAALLLLSFGLCTILTLLGRAVG